MFKIDKTSAKDLAWASLVAIVGTSLIVLVGSTHPKALLVTAIVILCMLPFIQPIAFLIGYCGGALAYRKRERARQVSD